jgi:hypothetical protein
MKIRFTHFVNFEDINLTRIIGEAGYSHEVDAESILQNIWNSGTTELAVPLELDTDTGIVEVVI